MCFLIKIKIMNNYIKRFYDKEIWKNVPLFAPFNEKYEVKISNYGIVKRIEIASGNVLILKQFLIEGYPSARFTMMEKMEEKDNLGFIKTRKEMGKMQLEIKHLTLELETPEIDLSKKKELLLTILEKKIAFEKVQKNHRRKYKKNSNSRKKTFGNLVHRLVAMAFLEKPTEEHNLVAHIDYDKHNNHHSNLKWMTREENVAHQKGSPFVIQSKILAESREKVTRSKLTISQVMILKKRINEGVSLRELAKRYVVTETQLLRIKRGENWAKIPAAL